MREHHAHVFGRSARDDFLELAFDLGIGEMPIEQIRQVCLLAIHVGQVSRQEAVVPQIEAVSGRTPRSVSQDTVPVTFHPIQLGLLLAVFLSLPSRRPRNRYPTNARRSTQPPGLARVVLTRGVRTPGRACPR